MVIMGLDQLIKIIIRNYDETNDDDSSDGIYKEYYFRKNYYLRSELDTICYTDGITDDNCINFSINQEEFFKLYDKVCTDLELAQKEQLDHKEYVNDNEWLIRNLERLKYVYEGIFDLFKKYPEEDGYFYELLYWQWY